MRRRADVFARIGTRGADHNRSSAYEIDFSGDGFEWIAWDDRDDSVLSWIRKDLRGEFVVVIVNFTPVTREHYRVGVPEKRRYQEALNTDDSRFGGSGVTNGTLAADDDGTHGRPHAITMRLPPLATVILKPAK